MFFDKILKLDMAEPGKKQINASIINDTFGT